MASNYFDKFDPSTAKPESGGNYFDQFDPTTAEPAPGFTARLGQGASRALDSAKTALTDDPNEIAKIAADQARTALPQTPLQRQLADEFKPYVDAANKAEGFVDNVTAWGAAGFKRAGQLLSNPAEAGKMIAEQLPNSLPGLAGGFAGAKAGAALGTAVAPGLGTAVGGVIGGIAGGFAGSYGLEKGAAMQEQVQQEAQKRNIDIQNQGAVAGMVAENQSEFDATAQRKGVGTAGTDAILNVATMGLAGMGGRALAKEAQALGKAVQEGAISAADASTKIAALQAANAARNTLGAKAARGAGVIGAEMVGEGVSEAVGQQYAYGEVDAGQVIDESLMGLGTGGAMALGSKAFNKAAGIVDQDATTQTLAAAQVEIERRVAALPDAPPLALGNTPDPMISFPDGSVGRQSEFDLYINGLPEEQRIAERAKLMGYGAQPADASLPATDAPQETQQLGYSPLAGTPTVFPDGSVALGSEAEFAHRYAPQPVKRSQAMGIDPTAGPLSKSAALAVDSGAYMPPAGQAPAPTPEPDPVVLQNRDRTSAASIAQMQEIAANPDYLRVGPSRDMTSGAPIVFGELPPTALLGRPETVADGHGERMGTQYAVVESESLIPSNNADGTTVAEYASGAPGKLRSVAGNGRTAGLQAAYQLGTTQRYRQELEADAAAIGVDAQALAAMQRPVLVRVMQGGDVTRDMGDRTNITATQKLSPLEQAGNDARRLDVRTLSFDEGGNPTADSIKGFVSAMPVAERGDMLNADGTPTRQAVDRLMAATFKQAYESDELVQLYAQASDPDARAVMAAAADASGVLANLKGAGEFDVRAAVADAAKMAVNAARQGLKLSDVLQNQDMDMHPEAFPVAAYLAQHIRTPKKMAEGLRRWGQLALEQARIAEENTLQGSLLGPRPTLTRAEIFARLGSEDNPAGQAVAPPPAQGAPEPVQAEMAQAQAQPVQIETAPAPSEVDRHPTWRQNAIQAGRVARDLGLQPKGKRLAQIVAEIDALDSEPNQAVAPATQAITATETGANEGRHRAHGQSQTQTDAFKRWFGDSAVVDAEGNPLVMYHGTSSSQDGQAFTVFDTYASNYGLMGMGGYFTADPAVSSSYTSKGKGSTPTVYPVYLSIKNPLDMDAQASPAIWRKQFPEAEQYLEGGTKNENWYRAAEDSLSDQRLPKWEGAEIMQDGLRAMGFDGITHIGGSRVKADGISHRVYIAFEPEQVKSATGNNGNFDRANPDIRFSFAGEKATTADAMALATAQERLATGEDAEVVRKDTGWHKAADGKWRFEISDGDAKLKDRAQWTAALDGVKAKRDTALRNKFAAEEARNAFLRARGESPSRISADTKKTPEFKELAKALKNAEAAADRAQDGAFSAERGGSLITVGDVLEHPALFAAYPGIAGVRVDINNSLPANNAAYAYELRAIELSGQSSPEEMLSTLLHEIQHGIQHIEGFAMGGAPSQFSDRAADRSALSDGAILSRLTASQGSLEKAKTEFSKRFKREPALGAESAALSGESADSMQKRAAQMLEPHERYRRLAGETEARNTQTRQKMTDAQRRAAPPRQTADVADADVIVVFNGKEMRSAPVPVNAGGGAMSPELARVILALARPAPATTESVRKAVRELVNGLGLLPNSLGRIVVATSDEIKQEWEPLIGPTGMEASGDAGKAQGFYDPKSKTVFLIADNIKAGDELGVVAHELMHKHGPAVLGKEGWNQLHGAIGGWAKAKPGSMERIVHDEAARRVQASGPELSNQELFPYAVQVALEMGVRPNAVAPQGTVARWLAQVRNALRTVWETITRKPDSFKSQDLVNLAFGIAQRENPAHAGELDGVVARSDAEKAQMLQGEPVAVLHMEDAPVGGYADVARWAADLFKRQGGNAISREIGEVTLNEQSARDSMAHGGANAAKKIAFAAVKDVIERGTLVHQASHGRKESFYISAPVRISGRDNIVTVLVHRDQNTQRMYLHSVALKENLLKPSVSAVDAKASERGSATTSGDVSTVSNAVQQGKAAAADVARELNRLLTLDVGSSDGVQFSRAADIENSMGAMTPEQEAAYKNVAGVQKVPTLKERAAAMKANLGLRMKQALVDQFAPIRDVSQHAYMMARMSKASDGAMDALLLYGKPFLRDGVLDVNINDGGFAKMLAGLKGEHDRFFMWVAAQRGERLKAEGKENLMGDTDISALKTLNAGQMADGTARVPLYARALQELNAFNEASLKVALESGLIDQDAYDLMKDQPYVPFYRLMAEEGGMTGPKFSSGLLNQKAWKKLKGGTQQLNADLVQNALQNWSHLYAASARNRAALATMDAAEGLGIAYKVRAETKGSVKVMRAGMTEHWMVEDPYLLEAVSALNYTASPLMKPLAKMKQLLTWGVTVNPTFKIRNLIRDSISAISQSELGYNPLANVGQGWKLTASDSQIYASMTASGGIIKFGTQENTDRLRAQVAKLGGVVLDEGGLKKFTGQLKSLYDVYAEFGDRTENVNRAALYDQLIKKGHSHAEASFMARDLMDFSMGGSHPAVRFLTQTVPFLNARLQGLYKLGRAAHADPRKFAAVAGAVSLASLALLAAYGDDEDWKKREDWDRDAYWWFKVGETAFRIPKPFEVGAIGTLAERTAELMFEKEMTNKRFLERLSFMFGHTFAFDPVPQAIKPLLDIYANKDSFTKRAIESQADQRLRPQDRYNERTSEVARLLGSWGLPDPAQLIKGDYAGLSPKQIDHLLRGYFSWAGATAATVSDFALRPAMGRGERPDMRLRDVFLAGNFVESLPTGSSRYVSQLYEQSRSVEQAYASYREAIKTGDMDKAAQIQERDGPKLRNRMAYANATKQLSEINAQAKRIEANRLLPGDVKRERLTELELRRGQVAKRLSDMGG